MGGCVTRAYSWFQLFHPTGNIIGWWEWVYYPTYNRLDGLLFGVCAAAVRYFKEPLWRQLTYRWKWVASLGLAVLYVAYRVSADQYSLVSSVFSFPLLAAGYGCLLIAAVSPSSALHRVRWTATSFIAAWSYAIYLTHKGVIHLSQQVLTNFGLDPDSGITFVLTTGACLVVAWLLHMAVEHPFMRLRAIVSSRRHTMRAPEPARVG